jgi:glycosyltransferase involved in cell wall biosynthesis/4-hydroxybenzoate polyprenyltransferase
MNVVHINASDRNGGAARACYRLHQLLLRQGVNSHLLVQQKSSIDPTIELIGSSVRDTESLQNIDLVQRVFAAHNRTDISNTHFSVSLVGSDFDHHPAIETADIIHLHWVASMLTPADIRRLIALGKPVVWTLHDLRPLTGGCHFTAGCTKFQNSCAECPQLRDDPFGLPAAALQDQIELINTTNLTIIAPSRWMAEQAGLSALLRDKARIEFIPNGIDANIFAPHSRAEARVALGLTPDEIYILCGADHTEEKRKGFESLARVLNEVIQDPRFVSAGARLLWVGDPPASRAYNDIPLIQLGRIPQEKQMALAFAASDLFVLPSLEDNLPNMLLEALSCGTPVVAYAVGGIPEVLHGEVNGRLVPVADERKFAEALLCLVDDAKARTKMGERARALASDQYSALLQVARHIELYRDLAQVSRLTAASSKPLPRHSDHSSNNPGPAVDALQKSLIIHCLTEEIRTLQKQLDTRQETIQDLQDHLRRTEETCVARLSVIEQLELHRQRLEAGPRTLQKQLDTRQEIIQDLQDHLRRTEETCAARLSVIEQLELHRQRLEAGPLTKLSRARLIQRILRGIWAIKELIRFDHWWYSKMPPLLTIAYLQIIQFGLDPERLAVLLPLLFFSIACVAAYGHVINDIFDIESDRLAGKPNTVEKLKPWQRGLICAALGGLGFLPALVVNYSVWGYLLLALNYLWPTVYSAPRIRLKERGMAGVFCDAAGSHLTPTLLVLVVLSHQATDVPTNLMIFSAAALVWSGVLGIKGILNHQVADRENDRVSGTVTLATQAASGRLERFLPRYNLLVELPVSAAFVYIVFGVCPLAVLALAIYCVAEAFKYRLGFQFALNNDPRNTRASFPFVNDFFYYFWFPLAATLQLVSFGPTWVWVPAAQLGLFSRTTLLQIHDLLALANVSRSHIGQRCAQFRLKRQLNKGGTFGS